MPTSRLTDALTEEYGHLLPPALIANTVATAAAPPGAVPLDEGIVERTARTDVAALAESVRRAGSAGSTP